MDTSERVVFVGADRFPCLIHEECTTPEIKEGEILAKILLATVCGSDRHTVSGGRKEATPSVLGHEAVVSVVESKRTDSGLRQGDRITFSLLDCCGKCSRCENGVPQGCVSRRKYGHLPLSAGSGFSGCYATHIVLLPGTAVFTIPPHVPDRVAAPINCALATMINALSFVPQDNRFTKVLIQGAGQLGLYGCALCTERGFSTVLCSDMVRERLVMATKFGAKGIHVDEQLARFHYVPQQNIIGVHECEDDLVDSLDVVVEVCGVPRVIQDGLRYLRPGGQYIFVGMVHPQSDLNITGEQIIRKCLTITGIHNYKPEHLQEAVDFISKTVDKYPYDDLLSPQVNLSDLPGAMADKDLQNRYCRLAVKP